MANFLVFMTRTRTVKEFATVTVSSSSEIYAKQDAASTANGNGSEGWEHSTTKVSEISFHHIEEL